MDGNARRKKLFAKKLCAQCLDPGTRFYTEHECSKEFACPNEFHSKFKRSLHVLVCSAHKAEQKNQELLTKFKRSIQSIPNLESFSKEMSVNFSSTAHPEAAVQIAGDVVDCAIFMLQTIEIGGKRINLFFDNGCGNMVIKKSAVDVLMGLGRANLEFPGTLHHTGVGGLESVCEHGGV